MNCKFCQFEKGHSLECKKIKKLNKNFHFHDFQTGEIDEDGEMIYEIKKCYADCPKLIIEYKKVKQ